ncbi:LPD38 domain-containing protein, partial [Paenibacillus zanthoxyli]|uniref:LPD38 domain-containing protein n=1 Tax=Paenibacillus zanthoxyli TaxID=369399 RepID=UPI0018DCEE01
IADTIGRVAPKVTPQTAQRIARNGLAETIAGPLQGVAGGLANQQDSDREIVSNALLGLAGGAVLGFGGAAAGAGLRNLFRANGIPESEVSELLALPEGRGTARQSAAAGRSNLAAGTEPIANPYAFELPEATDGTRRAAGNAASGRQGIREIDSTLNELNTRYEQAIIDEYKLLKQQRDTRGGVQQGQLQRNAAGEVVGRTGRISNNPLWYQEFYAENARVPTNKDLYELARQRVDTGFVDETGRVTSWREQNRYDEQLAGYQAARDNLAQSVREIDPAINFTDAPLATQRLKDLRQTGQRSRQQQLPEPSDVTIPSPTQVDNVSMTARERDINARVSSGGQPTQDDIDYLLQLGDTRAGAGRNAAETPIIQPETPMPAGEPILRPGQFDEQSGIGISAFGRSEPYDSLKTDTRSQLVTRQQRDSAGLTGLSDRAYTALVDDLHTLNQQDKILENILDRPLSASERTHTLGLASRGADVVSKRIITDGLVDSRGQVVGESFKDVLSPLKSLMRKNKRIYVDFEDYLLNKHAITRAERGEKVFRDELAWTPDYGAQKVAEYEQMFPEFKEAADKFYAFNQQMVKSWLVDTGIITQETADAWLAQNPFYVPNKRQFTKLEKTGKGYGGGKRGFGNQSNPVKGYQKGGSQRKIISPIEATIENVDAYVKAAKRNGVMQQYVRNIERAPEAFENWAEIVKQPERPADITKMLLTDDMEADGIDQLISRFSDDFDKAMQQTKLDKDNIVRAMVDGQPVQVKIKDPQLLAAVTALGPQKSGFLLNLVGKLTNNMKLLTTGNNPVFSLTRNLFRDIPQAYVASRTSDNPIAFAADLISAAMDIGMKRGAYSDFLNIGGGHASSVAADRNLLGQSKRAVLPQSGLQRVHYGIKDNYENFLNAVEIAPRLAEFKRVQKQGGDMQAALAAAQDLTVNFKRRGSLSGEVDKVFPYFNAALQGLDKTVRTYKDDPVRAIVKSIISITLPTMALYAVNRDDPNYQKLSNRVKDAFLMIPRGDGTFIKIAKPQEQGSIFSDLPERLMRLFADQDPAAFRDFADRLRTTFIPPGIQGVTGQRGVIGGLLGDTILGPGVDIVANESWSGAPVVPAYLQDLSPGLQADAKTTWPARKIGELTYGTPFEVSPKNIDYLTKQYTGWIGQFGQPLLSSGGDAGYALSSQMTADPVFSNDLSTEFYHYKDKLDQANNDSDLRPLPDWYSEPLRKKLAKISKQMSAIRADMRDVQGDRSLSNAAKRNKLRDLQEQINSKAEQGNALARDKVPY